MTLLTDLIPDVIRLIASSCHSIQDLSRFIRSSKRIYSLVATNRTVWSDFVHRTLTQKPITSDPKQLYQDFIYSKKKLCHACKNGFEIYIKNIDLLPIYPGQLERGARKAIRNGHREIWDLIQACPHVGSSNYYEVAGSGDLGLVKAITATKKLTSADYLRLMIAAVKGGPKGKPRRDCNYEIMDWLLPHIEAGYLNSCIHRALTRGCLGNLLYFLEKGFSLPSESMIYATRGSLDVVRFLVEEKKQSVQTHYALIEECVAKRPEIIYYLVEKGMPIDGKCHWLLYQAAIRYDRDLIEFLLEHGASFDKMRSNPVRMLLEIAPRNPEERNRLEMMIRFLRDRNAPINKIEWSEIPPVNHHFKAILDSSVGGKQRCQQMTQSSRQCARMGYFENGRCHQHKPKMPAVPPKLVVIGMAQGLNVV